MAAKKKSFIEVEKLLQVIGSKIEELIEKGKSVSGDARIEIEKKVEELKLNKEELERDLQNKKRSFDRKYKSKRKTVEPKLKKSGAHLREAFKQFKEAIKVIFRRGG